MPARASLCKGGLSHRAPSVRVIAGCRWLDRSLVTSPLHYTLVTSEEMLAAEQERLGIPIPRRRGLTDCCDRDGAAVWHVEHKGRTLAIVAIEPSDDRSPTQTVGMLVHEAVHIWQQTMRLMGEKTPSDEFMAYGIQRIAQELMHEYSAQTMPVKGEK